MKYGLLSNNGGKLRVRRPPRYPAGLAAAAPAAAVLVSTALVPVIYAAVSSLFTDTAGGTIFTGFSHIRMAATDPGLSISIGITAVWAAAVTLVTMGFGFLLGTYLHEGALRRMLYPALIVPWGVPVFILVPIWRAIIHGEGGASLVSALTGVSIDLLNDPVAAFAATVFVSAWTGIPIIAFAVFTSLESMPSAYLDATRMEGGGSGTFALRIFAPMRRNLLLALALLSYAKAVKEFAAIHLLTDGGPPLPGGVLERIIIGTTTTMEVYLYRVYEYTFDPGTLGAYALAPLAIIIPVTVVWLSASTLRSEEPGTLGMVRRGLPLLVAVLQPVFAGAMGIPSCVAYLAISAMPRMLLPLFGLDMAFNIVRFALRGFPQGLNAGFLTACAALPVMLAARARRAVARITPRKTATDGSKRKGSRLDTFPVDSLPVDSFPAIRGAAAMATIVVTGIFVYSLLWISLSGTDLIHIDRLIPRFATTRNFTDVFATRDFGRSLWNSLRIASTSAALTVAVAFPASVWLAAQTVGRSNRLLGMVQATVVTGGIHTLIPLFWMTTKTGLVGTYVPLYLLYSVHAFPVSLFLLVSALRAMPASLYDIARIEGCTRWGLFVRVLLPLARPALIMTAILTFIGAWNGFLAPLIFLYDSARYPVSLTLYQFVGTLGSASQKWGAFAAGSVINLALISGLLIYARKYLLRSDLAQYSPES